MSWVCSNCSNYNDDSKATCVRCGAGKPSDLSAPRDSASGVIVFSDSDVIKESIRLFFESFKKPRSPKAPRKARETVATRAEKPNKEKKKEKEKASKKTFAAPWPDHKIKFDIPEIQRNGFVRSERGELNSVKGYYFFREDGSKRFFRHDMLVVLEMARKSGS